MATQDNKGFWQRSAGYYGSVMRRNERRLYADVVSRIRPMLNDKMAVLELACGTGQLTYPLSGGVRLWEATDFSPNMIAEASKWSHTDRLRFSVQDATNLPFEHETFDAALISNALHIMPRPEKAMKEIRRVLRPGGLLFAPTYLHGGVKRRGLKVRLMEKAGLTVYHRWTSQEFLRFIEEFGFRIEEATLLPARLVPLCYVVARKTE